MQNDGNENNYNIETEERDAQLLEESVKLINNGNKEEALDSLIEITLSIPTNYSNKFLKDNKLFLKCWDMTDFLFKCNLYKDNYNVEDILWVKSVYPKAFYYIGYLYFENGEFENAIEFLDKGLKIDRKNPKIMNEKAQCYIKLGKIEKALEIYNKIILSKDSISLSDYALSIRGKGFVMLEENNLIEAKNCYEESLIYEPNNENAQKEIFIIDQLIRVKKFAKSIGVDDQEFNLWSKIIISTGLLVQDDCNKFYMLEFIRNLHKYNNKAKVYGINTSESYNKFEATFFSYYFTLKNTFKESNWNSDIDPMARDLKILTEDEITFAQSDFHMAVLNRIKVRIAMDCIGLEKEKKLEIILKENEAISNFKLEKDHKKEINVLIGANEQGINEAISLYLKNELGHKYDLKFQYSIDSKILQKFGKKSKTDIFILNISDFDNPIRLMDKLKNKYKNNVIALYSYDDINYEQLQSVADYYFRMPAKLFILRDAIENCARI
jgi:tetratricopeptide (TPR) repeat protein